MDKMGTGKMGTNEKLDKKGTKRNKMFLFLKYFYLLFNKYLNYSMFFKIILQS